MARILITDNFNSYNLGDAAILEGMRLALGRYLPRPEIRLTSAFPEVAERVHGLPAVAWTPRHLGSRGALVGWLVRSAAWAAMFRVGWRADALLDPAERRLMHAYAWSELVLGVGGAYLREGYRLSGLRLWQMLLARCMGRPVALYAHSIGPVRRGSRLAGLMRFTLARMSFVTLRDPISARILANAGIRLEHCEVTADAALALDSPSAEDTTGWAPPGDGPLVGVSVLHWHKFERGSFEAYANAVAGALDRLCAEQGARIHFLSTTIAPPDQQMDVSGTRRDDLSAARDVASRMRSCRPEQLQISDQPLGLDQLQARIAAHDLWIGTRMHSCIFATKAGLPTVAIGYEPKVAGYFELLDQSERVLDIEQLDADALHRACSRALVEANAIRASLAQRMPQLQARSMRNAELVASLLHPEPGA